MNIAIDIDDTLTDTFDYLTLKRKLKEIYMMWSRKNHFGHSTSNKIFYL